MPDLPFWKTTALADMSREQWESLCDGCARCCLHKLEDEDDGEIYYTNVVCQLMDEESCACTQYTTRSTLVPTCLTMTADMLDDIAWLPSTCGYRLIKEGRDLADWHPLVSGNKDSVHEAGISVRGWAQNEKDVKEEDLEEHIINWS